MRLAPDGIHRVRIGPLHIFNSVLALVFAALWIRAITEQMADLSMDHRRALPYAMLLIGAVVCPSL
jgi:hypothetical protein